MAESTMEIKHSGPTLEVSVSFGRFQSDSLSWEKWSSFSPNKYLEEVEKCSTPGSVAQKKAYFEAHYKMIAARKASEQMELEKLTESDSQQPELDLKSLPEVIDPIHSATSDFDHSNGKDVEVETCEISTPAAIQQNIHQNESLDNLEVSNMLLQELIFLNETKEESKEENTHLNESKIKADQKTEIVKTQKMEIKKNQKTKVEKKTQKAAANIKDDSKQARNSVEIKKKSTLPVTRSPQVSTQKIAKQLSSSMEASSSFPYQTSSALGKSKTPATGSKRIAPSSLKMSMSLGHANSNYTSSSSTRKYLIMEKMGDKDIVKRAFQSFQNSFNQLKPLGDEKSAQRKQVSATETRQKVTPPSSVTLRKENDRKTLPVKTDKILKSQPGSKGIKSLGLVKASTVDQRKAKPAPSPCLRNDERAEILKAGKKLVDKTAERKTYNSSNPKAAGEGKGRASEPKPKLNLNKANNAPNLHQGRSISKKNNLLEMDAAKLEKHYPVELHR